MIRRLALPVAALVLAGAMLAAFGHAPAPASPKAELVMAEAYLDQHQPAKAARVLESLARRFPHDKDTLDRLCFAYVLQRRCDLALPYLDKLVADYPKDPVERFNRGSCRFHTGDKAGGEADARAACAMGHQPACQLLSRLKRFRAFVDRQRRANRDHAKAARKSAMEARTE